MSADITLDPITRRIEVEVCPTPEELGTIIANAGFSDQAEFFAEFAKRFILGGFRTRSAKDQLRCIAESLVDRESNWRDVVMLLRELVSDCEEANK